jgi:hypothetical protein
MAKTNSKFFEYRKNLSGVPSAPTPVKILIDNSTTLKVGQMARVNTAGYVVPAGVGNAILGMVVGLIDTYGTPVNAFMYDSSKTGHTNSGDDTVVTASDNRTRATAVYAEVMVATEGILFYNDASADLAQTNLMQAFDLGSTSDQVDQATASDTSGQLQLIELNPDNDGDASKGLFRVSEPQLLAFHGSSTALNVA